MGLTIFTWSMGVALLAGLVVLWEIHRRRHWRDPQRLFTYAQKQILLERAGHRCEHKTLLLARCNATRQLEADHVIPWSRGGPTRTWNGQILCHRHNRRKSNALPGPIYRWRLSQRRQRYAP